VLAVGHYSKSCDWTIEFKTEKVIGYGDQTMRLLKSNPVAYVQDGQGRSKGQCLKSADDTSHLAPITAAVINLDQRLSDPAAAPEVIHSLPAARQSVIVNDAKPAD
jgi:hypothetical protein